MSAGKAAIMLLIMSEATKDKADTVQVILDSEVMAGTMAS